MVESSVNPRDEAVTGLLIATLSKGMRQRWQGLNADACTDAEYIRIR